MSNILYLFYVISKFGSFRHAEEVGFNSGCIQHVLAGRRKSHGGYGWRYSTKEPIP